ncbi:MAG: hypothetical protein ACI867_001200 [Glaciecola sp.]|jgi:hypothetical protein
MRSQTCGVFTSLFAVPPAHSCKRWPLGADESTRANAVNATMRAMLLTGHGGLDMLSFRSDVAISAPGAGEVLIAVGACGVNNTDINTRTGWYSKAVTTATGDAEAPSDLDGSWGGGLVFPRIQGADPAGRVVEAGPGVSASRVGERVLVDAWVRDPGGSLAKAKYLGSELDGGFAEYVVVPSSNAHRIDSVLSDVELASFPCRDLSARGGRRGATGIHAQGTRGGVRHRDRPLTSRLCASARTLAWKRTHNLGVCQVAGFS